MAAKRLNDRRNTHGRVTSIHTLTLMRDMFLPDFWMMERSQSAFSTAGPFKFHTITGKTAA